MSRATEGRKAVWARPKECHSYAKTIRELQLLPRAAIKLTDPEDPSKSYIYGLNSAKRMLTVSFEDGSGEIGVCPYPGCRLFGGNGAVCKHYYLEKRQWEIMRDDNSFGYKNAIIKDCGVTESGIKLLLNRIEKERKIDPCRQTDEGHESLIKSVGREVYVDAFLNVMVTQADVHSKSLKVEDLDIGFTFHTCAKSGCDKPAGLSFCRQWYCVRHYPQNTKANANYTKTAKTEAFSMIERLNVKREKNFIFKHLYKLGKNGYYYANSKANITLTVRPTLQFVMRSLRGSGNRSFLCTHPDCTKQASLQKFVKTLAKKDRRQTMCEDRHMNMRPGSKGYFAIEDFAALGIVYGCEEVQQATFNKVFVGKLPGFTDDEES